MTRKLLQLLIVPAALGLGGAPLVGQSPNPEARAAFAALESLEGEWMAAAGTSRQSAVRFELSANRTVPVEHYTNQSRTDAAGDSENMLHGARKLRTAGVMEGGQKLADEPGKIMRAKNGHVRVTDGPYGETKEVLGGCYIVSAENYDKAVDVARNCPHFEYGTTHRAPST